MTSVISQRPRDCLSCRIVSGGGLIGAGIYISIHSKKSSNNAFRVVMNILALVISQRPRDCLSCRIVSGGGLIGAGIYISIHSKKSSNNAFRVVMNILAL
ncbi:hypothetical protein B566_EDAN006410, partial [Ephemera danica]